MALYDAGDCGKQHMAALCSLINRATPALHATTTQTAAEPCTACLAASDCWISKRRPGVVPKWPGCEGTDAAKGKPAAWILHSPPWQMSSLQQCRSIDHGVPGHAIICQHPWEPVVCDLYPLVQQRSRPFCDCSWPPHTRVFFETPLRPLEHCTRMSSAAPAHSLTVDHSPAVLHCSPFPLSSSVQASASLLPPSKKPMPDGKCSLALAGEWYTRLVQLPWTWRCR